MCQRQQKKRLAAQAVRFYKSMTATEMCRGGPFEVAQLYSRSAHCKREFRKDDFCFKPRPASTVHSAPLLCCPPWGKSSDAGHGGHESHEHRPYDKVTSMDVPIVDHFRRTAGTVCLGTAGVRKQIRFRHRLHRCGVSDRSVIGDVINHGPLTTQLVLHHCLREKAVS